MAAGFQEVHDGDITLHILSTGTREALDAWLAAYIRFIQTHDDPFRLLIDFSSPDVGFSPYIRQTGQKVIHLSMYRQGRIAVILETAWGKQLVRLMLVTYRNIQVEYKIFDRREEALKWLRE